ncbi:MAG: helix-turn-helix domain-containing protein [Thermodesulfobacteriota bacterium]
MPVSMQKTSITSGLSRLDQILGGLFIGDNVVWYDESGSLAAAFWLRFVSQSLEAKRPVIFISFDRSPKNLFERLGAMGRNKLLTVLDCFTNGKGRGSETFLKFIEHAPEDVRDRILRVENPADITEFNDKLYGVHAKLSGDVRLVFESLTGMEEVWGGEEAVQHFYTHSCPRLYDLNTVAYWVMERGAHSRRIRALINQIAQVAISLAIRRGTSTLTVIKAEGREPLAVQEPHRYVTRGREILFPGEKDPADQENLGSRIKMLRVKRGFSQAELAKHVGVTPSTISQVESNTIYPSIPGLLKMAEVMNVEPGFFFSGAAAGKPLAVHKRSNASAVRIAGAGREGITAEQLTPMDFSGHAQPHIIELAPGADLAGHFFTHKGDEMGLLLEGKLSLHFEDSEEMVEAGDLVYLTRNTPKRWVNVGDRPARLFWTLLD